MIAEKFDIYNLANVDYIVEDVNSIYVELFKKAMEVISQKKELYTMATNVTLKSNSMIYGEKFQSVYPLNLYSEFSPNVKEAFYDYRDGRKTKSLGEQTTYYYNKLNYSGFDKIINPVIIEPAVEFTLGLQIQFFIEK